MKIESFEDLPDDVFDLLLLCLAMQGRLTYDKDGVYNMVLQIN